MVQLFVTLTYYLRFSYILSQSSSWYINKINNNNVNIFNVLMTQNIPLKVLYLYRTFLERKPIFRKHKNLEIQRERVWEGKSLGAVTKNVNR